jgi:mannose/cellobiose epimerase-like protein (N-acyl-D-glucosamine 2-epimerase family)
MLRSRHGSAAESIRSGVTNLLDGHLAACPRGTWRDQLDERGVATSVKIPASSLYHVVSAFAELFQLEQELSHSA